MTSWVETITLSDFAAHASTKDRRIYVHLTGTADLTVKDQLDHFLCDVHSEAQRCLAEDVTVDIRQLEFMNSSCLKCFVRWIGAVKERPLEGRYHIVFLSTPSALWQRRSLMALATLADEIVTI